MQDHIAIDDNAQETSTLKYDGITENDALTIQKVDAGLIKLEDLPIKN